MDASRSEKHPSFAVPRPEMIAGGKRRHVAFLLKRAPILLATVIPCFFLTLILLTRTRLTLHHSWLIAHFISAGVGGAILGLVERLNITLRLNSLRPKYARPRVRRSCRKLDKPIR